MLRRDAGSVVTDPDGDFVPEPRAGDLDTRPDLVAGVLGEGTKGLGEVRAIDTDLRA